MFYIYILYSKKDYKLYIGSTNNIKRRINEHNKGEVSATKNRLPIELIYYEAYKLKADAESREEYLKSGGGRKRLAQQLKRLFENIKNNKLL